VTFTPSSPATYSASAAYAGDTGHQASTGTAKLTGKPAVSVTHISVSGATVVIKVKCTAASGRCSVTFELTVNEKLKHGKVVAVSAKGKGKGRGRTTHKTVVIARLTESLKPRKSKTVRLTLNRTGRRLLHSRHRLRAKLLVIEGSKTIVTKTVTLR
jgi:hypothetical protein